MKQDTAGGLQEREELLSNSGSILFYRRKGI